MAIVVTLNARLPAGAEAFTWPTGVGTARLVGKYPHPNVVIGDAHVNVIDP